MSQRLVLILGLTLVLLLGACGSEPAPPVEGLFAFVGARVMDGTGNPPIENAVLIVRNGKVEALGPAEETQIPRGAQRVDLTGKTITPGFITGHGHVGGAHGLETGPEVYTEENILDQLRLYARYGVTTVMSLGGDGEIAFRLREEQNTPKLDRARIYAAGQVVDARTPQEAQKIVDENAAKRADFIKIRVDDNLGSARKMPPNVYKAIIEHAHSKGRKVAAHLYYLDDAKALLEADADYIVHSVRDKEVDQELIAALTKHEVCLCPTLTREVSAFVYEDVPDFFKDPFFLKAADPKVLEQLKDPERQKQIRESKSAQQYKKALEVAMKNLKILADSGVTIVFGTDTGPPARFQGYFEHMEMELMAKAGLTPMQILMSATGDAARCLSLHQLGTLQPNRWADFNVFAANPLEDIKNTKTLESVWISGNRLPE